MDLEMLLLLGGLGLISLGVLAAVVILVVVLVRRRSGGAASTPASGGPLLADTSPFADFQLNAPETSDSSSLSSAFVAGPRQTSPTVSPATGSESVPPPPATAAAYVAGEIPSHTGTPLPPPPPPPLRPAPAPESPLEHASGGLAAPIPDPGWRDLVASAGDPEPFQYTTGSFAVPTVPAVPAVPAVPVAPAAPAAPAAATPPLSNPWASTGPHAPVVPEPPAEESAPEPAPAPAPEPAPAAEPVPEPKPVTPPAVAPSPAPAPVAPPRIPPVFEAKDAAADDERTVLIAGRGEPAAPWLVILDSGERIGLHGEAAVLGRSPGRIEHGVPGLAIPDTTKTVSKVHARLDRTGEHWTVTDLDSTNGTILVEAGGRERQLPRGGSEVLRGRFLLGEVGLVIVRNPEAVS